MFQASSSKVSTVRKNVTLNSHYKWEMLLLKNFIPIQPVNNIYCVKAMADKNWELAVKLRGSSFQRNLDTYRMLTK